MPPEPSESKDSVHPAPALSGDVRISMRLVIMFASILFFVSCVILGVAVYFFVAQVPGTEEAQNSSETARALEQVSHMVDLPTNENPQIVPIKEVTELKKQAFFAKAEPGHVLILYVNNHLAILFDPKSGKIVNLSSISAVVIPPPAL